MTLRNIPWLFRLAAWLFVLPGFASAASKPLLAYYMPWFVAKPHSGTWGWHWTMNHFNPEIINAFGERQLASWYYPQLGPYDSADPAVLEYHVLLMKLAGLDGVVVDWYGPDDYNDYALNNQRTAALFQFTRKAGLKFCLCYEDQTIQQEVNGHFIAAGDAVAHAQQTLLYVQTNYFIDPSYLRWSNQPVLLNFGPQYFKAADQWRTIFSVLQPTNQPAFFTEDHRLPGGSGAFNWPPMWLSQAPDTGGVLSESALENYLNAFDQSAAEWPAFISSAFPRFHDIYQQAGVRAYWGYLGDHGGEILRRTLTRALTNHSAMVQIVTWNDFGEGTVVEPTREYGTRDLGIIQDCRRQFLDPHFAYRTNDFALASRLLALRRKHDRQEAAAATLDRVFGSIVAGDLAGAGAKLAELEGAASSTRLSGGTKP